MRLLLLILAITNACLAKETAYDPLLSTGKIETQLSSFSYGERKVPLKIYLPVVADKKTSNNRAPIILLSHGLGGSRDVGAYLGSHWAGRGFIVVAMQHIGSDDSVWKNLPLAQRFKAMKKAASKATFLERMRDVPATLDQLEKWNTDPNNSLYQRVNMKKIGLAGHSYGAITTQALCGQSFGSLGSQFLDKRITAGLPLSPSKPKLGDTKKAFASINIPMMLMTGTKDSSMIGSSSPQTRREVYPALPNGSKYELVLKDAKHMAFSDRTMTGKNHRNPNHHRVIQALSTAFWETYLMDSKPALTWLKSKQPNEILAPDDVWQHK